MSQELSFDGFVEIHLYNARRSDAEHTEHNRIVGLIEEARTAGNGQRFDEICREVGYDPARVVEIMSRRKLVLRQQREVDAARRRMAQRRAATRDIVPDHFDGVIRYR